jgi:hypothetical protein
LEDVTNCHHRFFEGSEYESLPTQVWEMFRTGTELFDLEFAFHKQLHTYTQVNGCLGRTRRRKCVGCTYGSYCGIKVIRRVAGRCPSIRVERPRIQEFPCVKKLVDYWNGQKTHCKRKSDCCKQGTCKCSSCDNLSCPTRTNCWPNSNPLENCMNYVSKSIKKGVAAYEETA